MICYVNRSLDEGGSLVDTGTLGKIAGGLVPLQTAGGDGLGLAVRLDGHRANLVRTAGAGEGMGLDAGASRLDRQRGLNRNGAGRGLSGHGC